MSIGRAEQISTAAADYQTQPIALSGVALVADHSGALYWPDERLLVVADLHLEKASAHAARGIMLPPYDTAETLMRLAAVIARYQPTVVVALGDSLHDRGAALRLGAESHRALAELQSRRSWIWVTGNHDPEIDMALGGQVVDGLDLRGLRLQHAPSEGPAAGEIAGHLHPAARISIKGSVLRRPCFVGDGERLVLPAFGAFTGGLNVFDAAFEPLFGARDRRVWMLGRDGVYPVAASQLGPD